jgi:hypothetical protein
MDPLFKFLEDKFCDLQFRDILKAYIIFVFYKGHQHIIVDEAFSVRHLQACITHNFVEHQLIGDSILWASSMFPKHQFNDLHQSIARRSYHQCYKLANKKIDVYEELSDNFEQIVYNVSSRLNK